jgi:hypothetical protein
LAEGARAAVKEEAGLPILFGNSEPVHLPD